MIPCVVGGSFVVLLLALILLSLVLGYSLRRRPAGSGSTHYYTYLVALSLIPAFDVFASRPIITYPSSTLSTLRTLGPVHL